MAVTEQMMRLGQWDLQLRDDTPYSIRSQVDLFDHVYITPSWVDITSMSDANMKSLANYAGVIVEHDEYSMSGHSMLWWLGTPDGVGPWPTGTSTGSGGNVYTSDGVTYTVTAVGTQLPSALTGFSLNGIVFTETGGSTGTSTIIGPVAGSFREFVDFLCSTFAMEYRITIDGQVLIGDTVFSTTPTVIVTRKGGGPEGTLRGMSAPGLSKLTSGKQIATDVKAVDVGGAVSTASAGSPIKAFDNTNASMIRRVASSDVNTAANTATALMNLYQSARDSITVDPREYNVPRFVKPGDYIYIWDVDAGLYDTANQVQFGGQTIHPIKLRLKTVTWPIERGMGVYLRLTGATPTYVDITQWVAFEDSNGDFDGTATSDHVTNENTAPSKADPGSPPSKTDSGRVGSVKQHPYVPPGYTPAVRGG